MYIINKNSVTLMNQDEVRTVAATHRRYPAIIKALENKDLDEAWSLADTVKNVKNAVAANPDFKVRNGIVTIRGSLLPNALASKLLEMVEADLDITPLVNFWKNCMKNPSSSSKQDLFAFLEANRLPITADGCFIAYKRINDEWKDYYTGQFDNRPGKIVKMQRHEVNPNREETCSTGLHVAAWNYAHNQYHSGTGRLVEVKVNPADVVTVPPDYDQQKMRACRYEVIKAVDTDKDGQFVPIDERVIIYEKDKSYQRMNKIHHSDGQGRLLIPAAIVRNIGLLAGHYYYLTMKNGAYRIYNRYVEGATVLTVDQSNNIRLTGTKGRWKIKYTANEIVAYK